MKECESCGVVSKDVETYTRFITEEVVEFCDECQTLDWLNS